MKNWFNSYFNKLKKILPNYGQRNKVIYVQTGFIIKINTNIHNSNIITIKIVNGNQAFTIHVRVNSFLRMYFKKSKEH